MTQNKFILKQQIDNVAHKGCPRIYARFEFVTICAISVGNHKKEQLDSWHLRVSKYGTLEASKNPFQLLEKKSLAATVFSLLVTSRPRQLDYLCQNWMILIWIVVSTRRHATQHVKQCNYCMRHFWACALLFQWSEFVI